MSRELDYFTEFLADPSKPTLREFYEMLNEWGNYVIEHQNHFNYLKDKKWKVIRERLVKEVRKRDREKALIDGEWDAFAKKMSVIKVSDAKGALKLFREQLEFLRKHQDYFNATDAELAEEEKACEYYEQQYKRSLIAFNNARTVESNIANAIVRLDEKMRKIEEKTGKKPQIFNYKNFKGRKGN